MGGDINILEVISGKLCPKGVEHIAEEMIAPLRTVTTTAEVLCGEAPLVSVRTSGPVPLEKVPELVRYISSHRVEAPVVCGQVLIKNVLHLGVDVISTRSIAPWPCCNLPSNS